MRVVRGPVAGISGRISRRNENYRIVLELTAMQSSVAVEVEMQDVEIDDRVGVEEAGRFAVAD